MELSAIAAVIQHTNVSPTATDGDIRRLCEDAREFAFNGVMVQPCWIGLCRSLLDGTSIKVCSAMAYPMGGSLTRSKVAEMRHLVEEGVDEVDFMPNLGLLLSGEEAAFIEEIQQIVAAAAGRPVKAMLELETLSPDERRAAVLAAEAAGCTYVKNSSGWGIGGHIRQGQGLRRHSLEAGCRGHPGGGRGAARHERRPGHHARRSRQQSLLRGHPGLLRRGSDRREESALRGEPCAASRQSKSDL